MGTLERATETDSCCNIAISLIEGFWPSNRTATPCWYDIALSSHCAAISSPLYDPLRKTVDRIADLLLRGSKSLRNSWRRLCGLSAPCAKLSASSLWL